MGPRKVDTTFSNVGDTSTWRLGQAPEASHGITPTRQICKQMHCRTRTRAWEARLERAISCVTTRAPATLDVVLSIAPRRRPPVLAAECTRK